MTNLQPVSMNNDSPKFGILFDYKQKTPDLIAAMENPLFSAKNFTMPKPGRDGNIFG